MTPALHRFPYAGPGGAHRGRVAGPSVPLWHPLPGSGAAGPHVWKYRLEDRDPAALDRAPCRPGVTVSFCECWVRIPRAWRDWRRRASPPDRDDLRLSGDASCSRCRAAGPPRFGGPSPATGFTVLAGRRPGAFRQPSGAPAGARRLRRARGAATPGSRALETPSRAPLRAGDARCPTRDGRGPGPRRGERLRPGCG